MRARANKPSLQERHLKRELLAVAAWDTQQLSRKMAVLLI